MITKTAQSKMWDTLLNLIPGLKNSLISKNYIDSRVASDLYSIWRTPENKKRADVYKRPSTLDINRVKRMQDAGLVKSSGEDIEITDKGKLVLKTMILGDQRSSFDDDGVIIDYNEVLNDTNTKIAKRGTKIANNWWNRFE